MVHAYIYWMNRVISPWTDDLHSDKEPFLMNETVISDILFLLCIFCNIFKPLRPILVNYKVQYLNEKLCTHGNYKYN